MSDQRHGAQAQATQELRGRPRLQGCQRQADEVRHALPHALHQPRGVEQQLEGAQDLWGVQQGLGHAVGHQAPHQHVWAEEDLVGGDAAQGQRCPEWQGSSRPGE